MRYDSLRNIPFAEVASGELIVAIPDSPANPGGPGQLMRVTGSFGGLNGAVVNGTATKVYRATLTQTGTDAPVATVLENTVGAIVWTRSGAGVYVATLEGAFVANKTFARVDLAVSTFGSPETAKIEHTSADVMTLTTYDVDSADDENLTATPVEILVYA